MSRENAGHGDSSGPSAVAHAACSSMGGKYRVCKVRVRWEDYVMGYLEAIEMPYDWWRKRKENEMN